jgi:hypothetical protein
MRAPAPIRWVLVRDPSGEREAQAFLCTDLDLEPEAILGRFVFRWWIETTFQEVREHLGVETQRQWSDLAILRTTPALLGLYSFITIWAHGLMGSPSTAVRPHPAVWYNKSQPTGPSLNHPFRRMDAGNATASRDRQEHHASPLRFRSAVFESRFARPR